MRRYFCSDKCWAATEQHTVNSNQITLLDRTEHLQESGQKMKSNFLKKREHKSQRKTDAQKGLQIEQMAFVLNGQECL